MDLCPLDEVESVILLFLDARFQHFHPKKNMSCTSAVLFSDLFLLRCVSPANFTSDDGMDLSLESLLDSH